MAQRSDTYPTCEGVPPSSAPGISRGYYNTDCIRVGILHQSGNDHGCFGVTVWPGVGEGQSLGTDTCPHSFSKHTL